jgi:formate hydrogenlyase subunit 3/multisubunit Na+/H+ antiporter MnhD subunit
MHRSNTLKQFAMMLMALGTMIALCCGDFITFTLAVIFFITIPGYFFIIREEGNFNGDTDKIMNCGVRIYIAGGVLSSSLLLMAVMLIYLCGHSVNFSDISHMLSFASERSFLSYVSLFLILLSTIVSICFLLSSATSTANNNSVLAFFLLTIVHTTLFIKVFSSVFYHLNIDSVFLSIACIIFVTSSVFLCIEKTMLRIMVCLTAYNSGISLILCLNSGSATTKGYIMLFLSEMLSFLGFFFFLSELKKGENSLIKEIYFGYDSTDVDEKTVTGTGASAIENGSLFMVSIPIFFLSFAAMQPILGSFAKFYTCISLLENEYKLPVIIFLIADCVRIICLAKMLQRIWQRLISASA